MALTCAHTIVLAQGMLDEAQQQLASKDYAAARSSIEKAKADASLTNLPRTHYLRGFIYKEIFTNAADIYPTARQIAIESFGACAAITEDNQYREDCVNLKQFMLTTYFNEGVAAFNESNYEKAEKNFSIYIENQLPAAAPQVYANALFYGGLAAEFRGFKDRAIKYYEQAMSFDLQEPSLYSQLAYLYESARDQANAIRVLDAGGDRFPQDTDLMVARINIYLSFEKYLAAEPIAEQYLAAYPDDREVLLVAGTIYQHNAGNKPGEKDRYYQKCSDVYQRVLKSEPDNYMANYNLGILLFNRAVDLIKMQEYDITVKNLDEVMAESSRLFKEALPFIEQANKLKPDNRNALFALAGIYYNMDDHARLAEIERKLETLN